MCTDTINATSVESLNVLGWRNMQNKPVEKEVWCLLTVKQKTLLWKLPNSGTSLKKMTKSALTIPWLKSAGHEELCFRLCTGSVTVVLWVPFLLSNLSTTRPLTHTLKCTVSAALSCSHSHAGLRIHFQIPSAGHTELSSKHPHRSGIPMRFH